MEHIAKAGAANCIYVTLSTPCHSIFFLNHYYYFHISLLYPPLLVDGFYWYKKKFLMMFGVIKLI